MENGAPAAKERLERFLSARAGSEPDGPVVPADQAAGNAELVRRGAELMERRVEHEQVVMSGWSPVGR